MLPKTIHCQLHFRSAKKLLQVYMALGKPAGRKEVAVNIQYKVHRLGKATVDISHEAPSV